MAGVAKGHIRHEKVKETGDIVVLGSRGGGDENLLKYTLFRSAFMEACSRSSGSRVLA